MVGQMAHLHIFITLLIGGSCAIDVKAYKKKIRTEWASCYYNFVSATLLHVTNCSTVLKYTYLICNGVAPVVLVIVIGYKKSLASF